MVAAAERDTTMLRHGAGPGVAFIANRPPTVEGSPCWQRPMTGRPRSERPAGRCVPGSRPIEINSN